MSLIAHAKKEMERMWPEPDVMQDMVKANVLELLKVFEKQGHSGSSAPYVLGLFRQLASHKPLGQNQYSRVKVDFPWSPPESKVIDVFVEE